MRTKEYDFSVKYNRKSKRKKMSMRFLKNCLLILMFLFVIHFWVKTKSYIFDRESIVRIGKKYAGQDPQQAFQKITNHLQERYPGHIQQKRTREWAMYKCSGQTLSISILHVSLTEYIVLTGSAINTDGYLGRHWLNSTFVVLSGSLKYWKEGTIEAIEYNTGDHFTVPLSESTGFVALKENTWVFEYGRGFLPMSLPSLIGDGLFTSFDVIGTFKILRLFAVAYFHELKSEIAAFIASI
ncbi:sigma non-opioid intracellular receptor 1-like [Dendronephthya gigantea]|uniref:sigma non-opioid intracellular receptor 1-like n=1 Tax=Dendronephthya gigantea TaxID=151771 RepID=UPI00106B56DA|nr:sigma non-opioid intracellular receptor 1-like [Dendronephthya gigantea]